MSKHFLIFLIDDSSSSNLYHKVMMEDAGINIEENVLEFTDAIEAQDYLLNIYENKLTLKYPNYILLDINMPLISGWEIVELLEGLNLEEHRPDVFMVSNSRYPADLEKAKNHQIIKDILEKHLDVDFFKSLLS